MTRAAFRQADIERILRAAKATGSIVKIDIRTLECTIHPMPAGKAAPPDTFPPDGPENFGYERGKSPRYGKENWDDE